jgi:hypothetical protein
VLLVMYVTGSAMSRESVRQHLCNEKTKEI